MAKNLDSCRSGKDFLGYAESHGAEVRNGHGSHFVVSTSEGKCVVPVHPGELGKGLRCKIIKLFVLIGLGLLACLIVGVAL